MVGGPEGQAEPGTLVHGNSEVFEKAATGGDCGELSGGSRIYLGSGPGGKVAASEAIRESRVDSQQKAENNAVLGYRLFVGKRRWGPGELEREVAQGCWQCAAVARPVALKQCLGLPKPLWHEVMELMGGDHEQLSKFELVRRNDLQDDDDGDEEVEEEGGEEG